MSAEEENLKAFEAELATLVPRADRLHRDRLLFLAGQASVARKSWGGTTAVVRWAWPAALAATTTVAAALLAVVLWRPPPQVVERIIEVPSRGAASEDGRSTASPEAVRSGGGDGTASVEAVAHFPASAPKQATPPGVLAAVRPGWLAWADRAALRAQAPYPRLLDQVLAQGVDSWTPPPSPPAAEGERASAPTSYRQLLQSLLEGPASGTPRPDRPTGNVPVHSGANS